PPLHSFPPRRSSDLVPVGRTALLACRFGLILLFVILENSHLFALLFCFLCRKLVKFELLQVGNDVRLLPAANCELLFDNHLKETSLVGELLHLRVELVENVVLALLIKLEADHAELFENILGRLVTMNATLLIESNEVSRADRLCELEPILETFFERRLHVCLGLHGNDKVDIVNGTIVKVLFNE